MQVLMNKVGCGTLQLGAWHARLMAELGPLNGTHPELYGALPARAVTVAC